MAILRYSALPKRYCNSTEIRILQEKAWSKIYIKFKTAKRMLKEVDCGKTVDFFRFIW